MPVMYNRLGVVDQRISRSDDAEKNIELLGGIKKQSKMPVSARTDLRKAILAPEPNIQAWSG